MPIKRRAIGADNFVVVSHIKKYMRMIEGRQRADAHEALSADLDDRHAQIIMEMGNDFFGHDRIFSRALHSAVGVMPARTIAGKQCDS